MVTKKAKADDSWLSSFSKGLKSISDDRAVKHAEFNKKLSVKDPVLFVPDVEDPRFGVGWFRADKGFVGYRRYANGYDPNSRMVMEDDFLNALIPHMPKKGKR